MTIVRFFCAAVLMLLATLAQAQGSVQLTRESIQVSGEVEVKASRALAWATLTDYEAWVRFLPDLQVSRIVARSPLRLAQRSSLPWLPGIPVVVLLEVVETPKEKVSFSKVQGNVLSLEGEWRLTGKDGALLLAYHALVLPGYALPANLSAAQVERDTQAKVAAMATEILRRAGE